MNEPFDVSQIRMELGGVRSGRMWQTVRAARGLRFGPDHASLSFFSVPGVLNLDSGAVAGTKYWKDKELNRALPQSVG